MSGIEKFKPQASPISGGGGGGTWGSITGTLSAQTDLQNALNAKQNTITTGTTAQYFRGDLSLATFPTNVSTFTNDSGYITSSALSNYVAKTGNETIAGLKTFTSDIYGTKDSGRAFRVGSLSGGDNNIWLGPSAISPTAANFVISTSINNSFTIFNSPSGRMYFGINNLYLFNVSSSGAYFGGTLTSATAKLHISAGSASANTAPLKFTSGTNLATPEAGAVEYNGSDLFFTPSTTRNILSQISGSTPLTAGSIPFATTGGYLTQDNSKLFWDNTNKRLGIGTNTPTRPLEIKSSDSNSIIARIENMSGAEFVWGISGGGYGIVSNVGTGDFVIRMTGDDNKFRFKASGRFGIGVTNPTALLHIKAGTASAETAPIKLTAGTNLATPEDGAFEFDGTNLYFTVGGVRKTVTLT